MKKKNAAAKSFSNLAAAEIQKQRPPIFISNRGLRVKSPFRTVQLFLNVLWRLPWRQSTIILFKLYYDVIEFRFYGKTSDIQPESAFLPE
jgi:hypothetical protein